MKFWGQKLTGYSKLNELAQDLLSAPASQAYVEWIFSLCGFQGDVTKWSGHWR